MKFRPVKEEPLVTVFSRLTFLAYFLIHRIVLQIVLQGFSKMDVYVMKTTCKIFLQNYDQVDCEYAKDELVSFLIEKHH